MTKTDVPAALEMWGGVECTVNRVRDDYFTQLDRSGHAERDCDLERFAALGIRALRYPVLWESTAPDGPASADWSWADRRLPALRRLGIAPDRRPRPPRQRAAPHQPALPALRRRPGRVRGAVAARFPWVEQWTPVNEPLTTARFSALYGLWYPHARDDRSFVAALLNQCRATVLSMAGDPPRQPRRAAGPDRRHQPHLRHGAAGRRRRLLQRASLAGLGPAVRPGRPRPSALALPARAAARRPATCSGSPTIPARPTSSAPTTT